MNSAEFADHCSLFKRKKRGVNLPIDGFLQIDDLKIVYTKLSNWLLYGCTEWLTNCKLSSLTTK